MESIYDYLKSDFAQGLKIWEENLKKELKTESLDGIVSKPGADGKLSVLSLSGEDHYLHIKESWKKASQTYSSFADIDQQAIEADLENGVRLFFFDTSLDQKQWNGIEKTFSSFSKKEELEIIILGESGFRTSPDLKIIFESDSVSGRGAHEKGGHQALELALCCLNYIEKKDPKANAFLYLDSEIFSNIAKLRALRLLLLKVNESWEVSADFRIIALTSLRDWTLYERYSNILKNVASLSAGYMGGADLIQSSGFLSLFEKLGIPFEENEILRSRTLARNTCHILAMESMLGVVEDPAFGSFQLENLTSKFAQEAWTLMQRLLPLSSEKRNEEVANLSNEGQALREKEMRKRKHVIAGINDFPDEEELGIKTLPKESFYRLSRSFEELRVRTENLRNKPEVFIGVFGNYALLNARVNFSKNYFQLLGLKVHEGEATEDPEVLKKQISNSQAGILILCAADSDYERLQEIPSKLEMNFLAGKGTLEGFNQIHAGQDVFETLRDVVGHWEGK